jgi:hypothetical protein
MQGTSQHPSLGAGSGHNRAFAASVALGSSKNVVVVAGHSGRGEAIVSVFIAGLVALPAPDAGVPGVGAASPAGADVGSVAKQAVVARRSVITADTCEEVSAASSIGATKLIGADVGIVAIGIGPALALAVVELAKP